MDLFLSSAIVASPPCGKGTFPAKPCIEPRRQCWC